MGSIKERSLTTKYNNAPRIETYLYWLRTTEILVSISVLSSIFIVISSLITLDS